MTENCEVLQTLTFEDTRLVKRACKALNSSPDSMTKRRGSLHQLPGPGLWNRRHSNGVMKQMLLRR